MQNESIVQKQPSEPIRVLLFEDNPGYAELIRMMLQKVRDARFDVQGVKRLSDGLQSLKNRKYDVVLLDLKLPDSQGIDTFDKVSTQAHGAPVIVLTVTDNDELALEAVHKGAQDYLVKDRVDGKTLEHSIRYAIERKQAEEMLKDDRRYLEEQVTERTAELRESEDRYRTFFEQSKDVIFVTDRYGAIQDVNQATIDLFGYTREEIMAMQIQKLFADSADQIKFQQLIESGGTVRDFEVTLCKKDGTQIFCLITASVWQSADRSKRGYQGIIRDITDRKQSKEELQRSYDQLRETFIATVNILASTIEMKDPYTAGHQRRVTTLACAIAEEMGLTDDQFDGLRMAGLIHDLGKINVPAEILSKPGQINDIELTIIKYHPQICHDILKTIDLPWPVAKIVLQHHERMDGSGYPQGLKGDEIMLESKILSVADVVEAMASHRPYRPALGIQRALDEIKANRGILYDPAVVDACIKIFTEKHFSFE